MKLAPLIFLIILFFVSCRLTKTNNSLVKMTDDKSPFYYEQPSPYINLLLLGDYRFFKFKTKYFRDIDKRFIKYVTLPFDNKKPEILYATQTVVPVYYSSMCIEYKNCSLDTTLVKGVNNLLKRNLKTSFAKLKEVKYGNNESYKISYHVRSSITEIATSNTEYFFKHGKNVYRLILWTTNSDDSEMINEAEYIIKEARFE